MKFKYILLLILPLIISCNTVRYKLSEKITGTKKDDIVSQLIHPISHSKNYEIEAIYTEKSTNYIIKLQYTSSNDCYHILLSSMLSNQMIFESKVYTNKIKYIQRDNSILIQKNNAIIKKVLFSLNKITNPTNLYLTNDDDYIITDENNTYWKFEENLLVKKENKQVKCIYIYKDNILERIIITELGTKTYIIVKNK